MHWHGYCWNCDEECLVWGFPCDDCDCDLVDYPAEFECWNCGAVNTIPTD